MRNQIRDILFNKSGWIALSFFIICLISGALLIIVFDITRPFLSISITLTQNPAGTFIRNIHYWSAQGFLVFFIFHFYHHYYRVKEIRIAGTRRWYLLVISIFFIFFVMISGFILKSDADSLQALRILSGLTESVPIAGQFIRRILLGEEGSLQIIYAHHIATASIIIIIAIYEHIPTFGVRKKIFFTVFIITIALSYLLTAPLFTSDKMVIKGPWYFVGLQEVLHYLLHPVYLVVFIAIPFVLLGIYPKLKNSYKRLIKVTLSVYFLLFVVFSINGYFFRGENWDWKWPWESGQIAEIKGMFKPIFWNIPKKPTYVVQGRAEGCMSCHNGMKGLGSSHEPGQTGCYVCHRGDPFTLDKQKAHRNMLLVPGNLSNASFTCGATGCHISIPYRVNHSLMTTHAGIKSVDNEVFEDPPSNKGAAYRHQQNLCNGCHLGISKTEPGPSKWLERGGGCNACHLTYSTRALNEFKEKHRQTDRYWVEHPSLDLKISNDHCLSCHSRSGRISLSYEGWHESTRSEGGMENPKKTKELPDKRTLSFVKSDVHYRAGMACIDCHGSYELMGDGKEYGHKEDAVNIQCSDCHFKKPRNYISLNKTDYESQIISSLSGEINKNKKVLITEKKGFPIINSELSGEGKITIKTKISNKILSINPLSSQCNQGGIHERLSCEACHTSWVPQCVGCHNQFDPKIEGWDMETGKKQKGSWVEYSGRFLAKPPVLGFQGNKIFTMMPGMILTIDKGSYSSKKEQIFKRLFAPASGHTTQKESRSCQSCHNDPSALGYGTGKLNFEVTGKTGRWIFEPRFENNKHDGLPEDAWIPFLGERKEKSSTRTNVRPFTLDEQKKILNVGTCLTCHQENSKVVSMMLKDFKSAQKEKKTACIAPIWK